MAQFKYIGMTGQGMNIKSLFILSLFVWLLADAHSENQASVLISASERQRAIDATTKIGNDNGSLPLPCFVNKRAWPLEDYADVSNAYKHDDYPKFCDNK